MVLRCCQSVAPLPMLRAQAMTGLPSPPIRCSRQAAGAAYQASMVCPKQLLSQRPGHSRVQHLRKPVCHIATWLYSTGYLDLVLHRPLAGRRRTVRSCRKHRQVLAYRDQGQADHFHLALFLAKRCTQRLKRLESTKLRYWHANAVETGILRQTKPRLSIWGKAKGG